MVRAVAAVGVGDVADWKYFHQDGIAIHGYPRVPAFPASHGCVRVSMGAMDYLWNEMPVGTPVWVY